MGSDMAGRCSSSSAPPGQSQLETAQVEVTRKLLTLRGSSPCLQLLRWLWGSPKGVGEMKAGILF